MWPGVVFFIICNYALSYTVLQRYYDHNATLTSDESPYVVQGWGTVIHDSLIIDSNVILEVNATMIINRDLVIHSNAKLTVNDELTIGVNLIIHCNAKVIANSKSVVWGNVTIFSNATLILNGEFTSDSVIIYSDATLILNRKAVARRVTIFSDATLILNGEFTSDSVIIYSNAKLTTNSKVTINDLIMYPNSILIINWRVYVKNRLTINSDVSILILNNYGFLDTKYINTCVDDISGMDTKIMGLYNETASIKIVGGSINSDKITLCNTEFSSDIQKAADIHMYYSVWNNRYDITVNYIRNCRIYCHAYNNIDGQPIITMRSGSNNYIENCGNVIPYYDFTNNIVNRGIIGITIGNHRVQHNTFENCYIAVSSVYHNDNIRYNNFVNNWINVNVSNINGISRIILVQQMI